METIADSLDKISIDEVQNRNKKIRQTLRQQKQQLILHLTEQEYEITHIKKNRYTCSGEDLQKGLNMFVQASKNLLDVYFPIFMDDKYLELLCQEEINQKILHLKSIIQKNWNNTFKQLVKPKQQIEQIQFKMNEESKKRGKNCKIPVQSTCVMQKWLLQNFSDPYPSQSKKIQMAKLSNLSIYQVNNWFINVRERVVKKFYKKQIIKSSKEDSE